MYKLKKRVETLATLFFFIFVSMGIGLSGCAKTVPAPIEPPKREVEEPVEEEEAPPPEPVEKPEPPPPPPPPPPPEEPVKPKRIPEEVEFIESNYETIYYDYDKSHLTTEARRVLGNNADLIRRSYEKHPELKLLVEGHCDQRGTNEYNLALGERRAFSARDYLISLGIPANILFTKSWGEEKPVDPEHSEKAWARNRRVEFNIYKGE